MSSGATFAQVDFVEFIRRRDLSKARFSVLSRDQKFIEVATDFSRHVTSLRLATACLEANLSLPDIANAQISRKQISKAIAYAGYCSRLPKDDSRYLDFSSRQTNTHPTVSDERKIFYHQYQEFSDPTLDCFYQAHRAKDELLYINYVMLAFREQTDFFINNPDLLSLLISRNTDKAPSPSPLNVVDALTVSLPILTEFEKHLFISEIQRLLSVGLLIARSKTEAV